MMLEWHISPCRPEQHAELIAVCQRQWTDGEALTLPDIVVHNIESSYSFEQYVADNWLHIVVAQAPDGRITGFGLADGGEIFGVGVHPAYWRLGVGRALMDYLEADMRQRGETVARLEVYADNDNAVQFYTALGYALAAQYVSDQWGALVTMWVMSKALV